MNLLDLLLSAGVVVARDSGKAEDVARLLAAGLSAYRIGVPAIKAYLAVQDELKAMQEAGHVPTREEKDERYNRIIKAIDAVKPA